MASIYEALTILKIGQRIIEELEEQTGKPIGIDIPYCYCMSSWGGWSESDGFHCWWCEQ